MLKKLLPYLKPYRWRVVWALSQVFLIAGFELLKPWPLQVVIDNVLGGKPFPIAALSSSSPTLILLGTCLAIIVVHLGAGALTLLHNYTTIRVGQNMVNDLRGALYAHLQRLSLAFHGRQRVGDLLYRVTADSFAVQTMIMNGALPILSAAVLLGGMLVVLFPLDSNLTLLALTVIPILFALISGFNRKIVDVATEVRNTESRVYSLVQLIVFISYLAQLYAPINQITQSWGLIAGARVGARRVFEVLDTEADLKDGRLSFPPEGARGEVAWRGVSFRYRPDTPVLAGIDFKVAAGAKIAVIGPTGAGKSTLLGLLPRFFDPSAGVVEIDGVDVREYQLKSLREQIAMVLQPPLIFPLSVRDNIAYGRPGAADAEIEEAARLARIHDLVVSLPEGYDTVIGESGISLSEGEKQRVTIARALLRGAPILILDEPTSALDVSTEALVMAGIERLMEGRTTFIIAHRLSTVRRCDRIIVLRDGAIVEQGALPELLRRDGVFAEYYRTQFAPEAEAEAETRVGA